MKLCWLYHWMIRWNGDDEPKPGLLQRHLHECAACRRVHQGGAQLTARLKAEAPAHLTEPPPFLQNRILAALRQEPQSTAPHVFGIFRLGTALIPAVAILVVLGYWMHDTDTLNPSQTAEVSSPTAVQAEKLLAQSDPGHLLDLAGKLDQPLQSELNSVVSDAKTALQSLTENFVPSQFLAQNER
jgi:hypothetical protein